MKITASYYQSAINYPTAVKDKNEGTAVSSSFTVTKADATVSVKQTKDVWKQLKEKYDIRVAIEHIALRLNQIKMPNESQ